MQRKDEILAKKAKLAELRRQREERERKQKELSQPDSTAESTGEVVSTLPTRTRDRQDLDSFIDNLVGDRRSSLAAQTGTSSPGTRKSRPTSTADVTEGAKEATPEPAAEVPPAKTASVATQTLSIAPISFNYEFSPTPIPPPGIPSQHKTPPSAEPRTPAPRRTSPSRFSESDSDAPDALTRSPRKTKRRSRREREREEELRQNLRKEIEDEMKAVQATKAEAPPAEPKYPARPLTDEELNAVTASEDFLEFVERSSKVIERALDQDYDVLANYAQDGQTGVDSDDEDDAYGKARGKKGRRVRQVAQFYDERWSKKRMISDIDFSPK
ncbi:MAG: hypothetical protein LQ352_003563, partial [Teloschistes flavicans]